jgi:hypothetical protein
MATLSGSLGRGLGQRPPYHSKDIQQNWLVTSKLEWGAMDAEMFFKTLNTPSLSLLRLRAMCT